MKINTIEVEVFVREEREGYWYATLGNHKEVKGCPMGRGGNQVTAIGDLIYRVGFESDVILKPTTITCK